MLRSGGGYGIGTRRQEGKTLERPRTEAPDGVLPDGVVIHALTSDPDPRDNLVEMFRESWGLGCRPLQWNAITSPAGVLRGVQVHVRRVDDLALAAGRMRLGLHDPRPWSPTSGASTPIELDACAPCAAIVPAGVAHGPYSTEPSLLVHGASHCWDADDELACRRSAPELYITWPLQSPILSERESTAADYAGFVEPFLAKWAAVHGSTPGRAPR